MSPQDFVLMGKPLTENANRLLAEHYGLLVGLRRCGLEVAYEGNLAEYLPLVTNPCTPPGLKEILFEKVFSDHLQSNKRQRPLSKSELQGIFEDFGNASAIHDLSGIAVFDSDAEGRSATALVSHGKKLFVEVHAVDGKIHQHRIKGFSLNETILEQGIPLKPPKQRRTWGEAWIAHDVQKQTLVGLSILESEICLITDRAYRYQLIDMDSMKRRQMTFGSGASEVFSRDQWLSFSRTYHNLRNHLVAMRCLEQAEFLCMNAEQRLEVNELRKIMRPRPKTRIPDAPSLRFRPLTDLESLVSKSFFDGVSAIEKERSDAYLYSDYGRTSWDIAGTNHVETDDEHFKNAGFTQQILSKLTETKTMKTFPERLPELFALEVAGRKIWGGRTTGVYYIEGIPNTVFGPK